MKPQDYIEAARVPERLKPQTFGLWTIKRWDSRTIDVPKLSFAAQLQFRDTMRRLGFPFYTLLHRHCWATLHLQDGGVVMEDSREELRKHLPIWLNAKGTVLVSGLGLGCVVRGLLASKHVEHITVVEIDKQILRIVGHEFQTNKRVEMIHGDVLKVQFGKRKFDYAWHDIHSDEGQPHLQVLHAQLLVKFSRNCAHQGAWQFPRWIKRKFRRLIPMIG